jgi:hypothetical protein
LDRGVVRVIGGHWRAGAGAKKAEEPPKANNVKKKDETEAETPERD